ncbi:hypothetical protein [Lysobacter capsici]|nr:hypothetical protein [Lysobacter capsici]
MGVGWVVRFAGVLVGFSVAAACMAQAAVKGEADPEPQALRTPQLEAYRASRQQAARASMTAHLAPTLDFDQARSAGPDPALFAAYEQALQRQIRAHWSAPTLPREAFCRLYIRQLPGGQVIATEVRPPCAFDAAAKRSLESAVLKAQPLAYEGFEALFSRSIVLTIRAGER